MNITNVRFMGDAENGNFLAYCVITIDSEFVIHDLRILNVNGKIIVAMPSRKMHDHCTSCNSKNCRQARFCNYCGKRIRTAEDIAAIQRDQLYTDTAHPITKECRDQMEKVILQAYLDWLANGKPMENY